MMKTPHQSNPSIGYRIKGKREEAGLTIRELARRADLTASFISQVENGKVNASLDSLHRLSKALGVQILYFLSEPQAESAVEEPQRKPQGMMTDYPQPLDRTSPLIKKTNRANLFLPDSGINYELLTGRLDHKMEAFIVKMSPGTGNVATQLSVQTEEFIFCLTGVLQVGVLDQMYFLEAGDSICFEGHTLNCLACGSDTEETTWLSVITPPAF